MLINQFGTLEIQEDDNLRKNFYVGVLDTFSKALDVEEAKNLLIAYNPKQGKQAQSKYFEQETKFLHFFNFAFELEYGSPIYVYCPDIFSLKEKAFNLLLKPLSDKDRKLLSTLLEKGQKNDGLYKVQNIFLFHLFTKLSLREFCFSNFFFTKSGSVIIGNYELSLPIYCLTESVMRSYEKKASEIGLYIRK